MNARIAATADQELSFHAAFMLWMGMAGMGWLTIALLISLLR